MNILYSNMIAFCRCEVADGIDNHEGPFGHVSENHPPANPTVQKPCDHHSQVSEHRIITQALDDRFLVLGYADRMYLS
jgi:hypothetical protein